MAVNQMFRKSTATSSNGSREQKSLATFANERPVTKIILTPHIHGLNNQFSLQLFNISSKMLNKKNAWFNNKLVWS